MKADVVVLGAGIAGLACARALSAGGAVAGVLDKARGVGGRCATRRVDGQPVDHGLAFLHGADPGFCADLEAADAAPLHGWPLRLRGAGRPCQPDAFAPGQRRLAYADGVTTYAKHLARGLTLRLKAPVLGLAAAGASLRLLLEDGGAIESARVVLALPAEQALALIRPLAAQSEALAAAAQLLGLIATAPSLTVLAGYPDDAPLPDWDIWHPEDSSVLQLASHDSSKRRQPRRLVLVLQASPRWSRERLDRPAERWTAELLAEAARLLGPWAGAPVWAQAHRWRHARVDRASGLTQPILSTLAGGAQLGLTGEAFAPGGGAEAAWRAGCTLARRLLRPQREQPA